MADSIDFLFKEHLNPEELTRKYNAVKADRATWDSTWNIIQRQIFPNYRDYVSGSTQKTEPAKNHIRNYSAIIVGLINGVVSELNSKVCDPTVKWMDLRFGIPGLENQKVVQDWLFMCKEALYRLFADPSTGFYSSSFSFHLDWFTIGTACREIILRKDTNTIKFNTISMQDIYIELSGYGDIDTVFRRFKVTAKQAISLWGENNLHQSVLDEARNDKTGRLNKLEFFEVVMPNPLKDQIPTMDYVSCVIDKRNKQIVTIDLHARSPYIISRFMVTPGETYGRSLVWFAMPNISIANRLMMRSIQGVDYISMPVILVKDGQSLPRYQITPGGFIQGLDSSGRPTYQPLQFTGDISIALQLYNIVIEEIKRCILADNTYPYTNDNKTATEINSINIQMANRMRPPIVMLEYEELYKTVLRTLTLLNQIGQLPPFPYEELGIDPMELPDPISNLRVTFAGQMFNMQRLQDIQNSDSMLEKIVQLAQVDPSILDRINLDAYAQQLADIYRVSPNVINGDEVVTQIRNERAQAQQEQMQQQQIQMFLSKARQE